MMIFNKTLHVESTVHMGWLLRLFNSLDATLLLAVITKEARETVALQYRYIHIEKYETSKEEHRKWMVNRIECDAEDRKKLARGM